MTLATLATMVAMTKHRKSMPAIHLKGDSHIKHCNRKKRSWASRSFRGPLGPTIITWFSCPYISLSAPGHQCSYPKPQRLSKTVGWVAHPTHHPILTESRVL